jgi:hypothetical protein
MSTKMVKGARALAAALAGAELWIEAGKQYLKASPSAVHRFEKLFRNGHAAANVYAVKAADATAVLGKERSL